MSMKQANLMDINRSYYTNQNLTTHYILWPYDQGDYCNHRMYAELGFQK